MNTLDWSIAIGMLAALIIVAFSLGKFCKSVADFLLGGRKIRKYLGMSAGAAEGVGLGTIAANMQQGMTRGFALMWTSVLLMLYTVPIFGIMGFGIKRFRATKCMTIPQFLEQRYHKDIRLLLGLTMAVSGILNMAIFPIVGSNILVKYAGLPASFMVAGLECSTVYTVMVGIVALAVFFTFIGGMVTVVVTDFIQASIMIGMIVFAGFLTFHRLGVEKIHETLTVTSGLGAAAFNPFLKGSYGVQWVLWLVLLTTVNKMAFAPAVQKMASADSPETARKMDLLQSIFGMGMKTFMLLMGVGALAMLGATPPAGMTESTYQTVAGAMYLREILPHVILGITFAAMLFAEISTEDSYLLSWSAVIINDIVAPLKKKPFNTRQHIWAIRIAIACIGLFLIGFGFTYNPTMSILDYMYITGTIISGVGLSVLFGLYWKRATTAGTVGTVLVCLLVPLFGLFGKQEFLWGDNYPLSPQQSGLIAIIGGTVVMVCVSLLTCKGKQAHGWVDYGKVVKQMDAAEKAAKLARKAAK